MPISNATKLAGYVGAAITVGGASGIISARSFDGNVAAQQLSVSGFSTFLNNIKLGDGDKIIMGSGNDMEIYHEPNANSSIIYADGLKITGGITTFTSQVDLTNTKITGITTITGNITGTAATFTGNVTVGIDTSAGVILKSPNGTSYRLYVENDGTLKTTLA